MEEEKLLKKYGSPLYLYNEEILINRAEKMMDFSERLRNDLGIPKIKMHYSTKANGNIYILKKIQNIGLSIDAMSPTELKLAELAGFSKENILYVCNNISQDEMADVINKGITICLDSIAQVELLGQIRPNSDIMIRINPGIIGVGHSDKVITSGDDTKFGIDEKNFEELFSVCNKYNLKIIGIHQHLGSLFLNDQIEQYINGVESGLKLLEKYFDNFNELKIIDLGGGFGVPYKDDEKELELELVVEKLKPILSEFVNKYHMVEFKFEPGRYVICESGFLLGTITSIKNMGNKIWVGTDIGMNILLRPSMYNAYHKIEVIKTRETNKKEYIVATIVGNICESGDILGKDRKILKPEVGDIIKVHNCGAYGYSMSSNYTGRLRPAEVIINEEGEDILIRRKETADDLIVGAVQCADRLT